MTHRATAPLAFAALFLILIVARGCATAPPPDDGRSAVTVPYETTAAGAFVVRVRIDGNHDLPLIIDTGSTVSGIFEGAALDLGIPPDAARTATVRGVQTVRTQPVIPVSSLSLGGTEQPISGLVVLRDSDTASRVRGVLGMDFLRHYALVVDHRNGTVQFVPHAAFSAARYRGWTRVALREAPVPNDYPLHFVDLTLDGSTLPALLDLGSFPVIINDIAFRELTAFREQRRLRATGEALEGANSVGEAFAIRVETIRMGFARWVDVPVLVLPLSPLAPIGARAGPFGIAGAALFQEQSFAIDFHGRRLYLEPRD